SQEPDPWAPQLVVLRQRDRPPLVHHVPLPGRVVRAAWAQRAGLPRAGPAPRSALARHPHARARAEVLDQDPRRPRRAPARDPHAALGDTGRRDRDRRAPPPCSVANPPAPPLLVAVDRPRRALAR